MVSHALPQSWGALKRTLNQAATVSCIIPLRPRVLAAGNPKSEAACTDLTRVAHLDLMPRGGYELHVQGFDVRALNVTWDVRLLQPSAQRGIHGLVECRSGAPDEVGGSAGVRHAYWDG